MGWPTPCVDSRHQGKARKATTVAELASNSHDRYVQEPHESWDEPFTGAMTLNAADPQVAHRYATVGDRVPCCVCLANNRHALPASALRAQGWVERASIRKSPRTDFAQYFPIS